MWQLSQLIDKYWSDARQFIYDYWDGKSSEVYYQTPKKIIVHHSATDTCSVSGINKAHSTRTLGMNTSTVHIGNTLSDVSYHRVIGSWWEVSALRKDNEVGRWTKVNNTDTIHILFCWNFNETKPTIEQYKAWAKIIAELRAEYWDLPVYGHNQLEWEATACPGKNFDYRMLTFYSTSAKEKLQETNKIVSESKAGIVNIADTKWKITAYYNCIEGQDSYFKWNYLAEKKLNWCWAFAAWRYWLDDHKYNHGACPKQYPLWTKLWIDWRSDTHWEFTCVDRWSGIVGNHIDIRYGIGQEALNNIRWWLPHPTRADVKVVKLWSWK